MNTTIHARTGARGQDKADAILAGAMQEFLAHGYASTSMDRVAAAAGVAKQTVYSYYRDKDRLFAALIERLAREKYAAIFASGGEGNALAGDDAPIVALHRLLSRMLTTLADDPQLLAFIRLIVGESGRFPALAQAFVREIDEPLIADLARYLGTHPELRLADPHGAAVTIFGTLFYTAVVRRLLGDTEIATDEQEQIVGTLLDMVTAHAAR